MSKIAQPDCPPKPTTCPLQTSPLVVWAAVAISDGSQRSPAHMANAWLKPSLAHSTPTPATCTSNRCVDTSSSFACCPQQHSPCHLLHQTLYLSDHTPLASLIHAYGRTISFFLSLLFLSFF